MSRCTHNVVSACAREGRPVSFGNYHTTRCDAHTPEALERQRERTRARIVIVAILAGLALLALAHQLRGW